MPVTSKLDSPLDRNRCEVNELLDTIFFKSKVFKRANFETQAIELIELLGVVDTKIAAFFVLILCMFVLVVGQADGVIRIHGSFGHEVKTCGFLIGDIEDFVAFNSGISFVKFP